MAFVGFTMRTINTRVVLFLLPLNLFGLLNNKPCDEPINFQLLRIANEMLHHGLFRILT